MKSDRLGRFVSYLQTEAFTQPEELFAKLPSKFVLLYDSIAACISARVNEDAGIIRIEGTAGLKEAIAGDMEGMNVTAGSAISPEVLETLLISTLSEKYAFLKNTSPLFYPLVLSGGTLLGCFLFVPKPGRDLEQEKEELDILSHTISVYAERTLLAKQVEELEKNYSILFGLSSVAQEGAHQELRDTVRKITETSTELFDSAATILYRKSDEYLIMEEIFGNEEVKRQLEHNENIKRLPLYVGGAVSKDWFFGSSLYQEKLESHLLPHTKHMGVAKIVVIPLYPFGKDIHFIIHLLGPTEAERLRKLEKMVNPFADLASVAVESQLNKLSLFSTMNELFEEKKRISWLLKLSNLVSSTLDVEHTLSLAVMEIRRFFRIHRCGIVLRIEDRDEGILIYSSDEDKSHPSHGGRLFRASDFPNLSKPVFTKRPLLLNNAMNHDLTPHEREVLREYSAAHLLIVPVVHYGETTGLITMTQRDLEKKFLPTDVEMAQAVASQLGSTIHNATMYMNVLKSKNEWEHTFHSISDMIFVLDRNYTIVNCNESFLKKHRLSREEAIGKTCHELFQCEKYPTKKCEHVRCMEDKKPVESIYKDFQIPGTFRVRVSPILNESGEVEKTVHLIHDITREKEYEAKLSESLKKMKETSDYLETLLYSSPDCIISADASGHIVFLNRGAEELLEYGENELVGKSVGEVYPSIEEARRVGAAMRKNGGWVRNFSSKLKRKDGTLIDVLISVATLYDEEGNKTGTVGISKDVSNVKKMEEHLREAEKLTALGKLASGIAHDFNNILTAISMRTELLKMRVDDEELLKELNIIETAAIKGADTVDKLKTFYRRDTLNLTPTSLNDVIREAVDITSPRWKNIAESRGIHNEIFLDLDRNLKLIDGNEGELKNVFINLIINAVDAMPEGGTITIKTSSIYDSVRVTFTDTGTGMTEEVKQRAFEPFFSTKGDRGTGLGLSTVYGIVTRHGGTIEMESEPGKGTRFVLTFPCTHKTREVPARKRHEAVNLEGVEVFLFEDEESIRVSLAEILAGKGCSVSAFSDPLSGLAEVEKTLASGNRSKKRVVVTDLGMPGMNGFEITKKIKMANRTVHVIMLTGWGSFVEPSQASLHGVDRILSKPVRSSDLVSAIAELIS